MSNKIKLFIVDDHEIFRNGLKTIMKRISSVEVVGEASNGKEFLEKYEKELPDVVLMDIEMPEMTGQEATVEALKKHPELNIIALTMFNEDEYIKSMIDAGVKGFLLKNINKETLEKAIHTVHTGGNYYSEELFNFFTKQFSGKKETPDIHLTKREKEILQLICEGLSNKEIADMLFVSERTVVGHKSNLLSKTGCKNTLNLLSYAIKNKLVVL